MAGVVKKKNAVAIGRPQLAGISNSLFVCGIPEGVQRERAGLPLQDWHLLSRRSFVCVRNHIRTRRPNAVQPTRTLSDFRLQPDSMLIRALLRTEALESSTMAHEAELSIAVGAMVIHSFLPNGVWA